MAASKACIFTDIGYMLKLYDYYRSTACYRVRIALHYKGLPYEALPVHLLNQGGEQHHPAYVEINPQQLVPTLVDNEEIFHQSLAIIEYLEEQYPQPPLLPSGSVARAQVRGLAQMVACDLHPLNNLRVLQYLQKTYAVDDQQKQTWYHHWLQLGFTAIEKKLSTFPRSEEVCYGHHVTLADMCLIPQVYNAKRFAFPMEDFPFIMKINRHCLRLPAFADTSPDVNQ